MTLKYRSNIGLQDKDLAALEQAYTIRQRYRVLAFLEQNLHLLPVLLEAPHKIKPYFPHARLLLDLSIDNEAPNWEELVLLIGVNEFNDEIQATEDKLNYEWFYSLSDIVRNQLIVTIDIL